MDIDNPFDRRLENVKRMPPGMRSASIDLTDTLDLCWAAAQAVFGKAARPEHALQLLPMFMQRAASEDQRQQAEARAQTAGASTPPAAKKRSRPTA